MNGTLEHLVVIEDKTTGEAVDLSLYGLQDRRRNFYGSMHSEAMAEAAARQFAELVPWSKVRIVTTFCA
jgi:hypothetical protein